MKTRHFQVTVLSAALLAGLGACGGQQNAESAADANGREETRNIRNTESIGYSGEAIANQLDGALDAHDQRQQQLDQADQQY